MKIFVYLLGLVALLLSTSIYCSNDPWKDVKIVDVETLIKARELQTDTLSIRDRISLLTLLAEASERLGVDTLAYKYYNYLGSAYTSIDSFYLALGSLEKALDFSTTMAEKGATLNNFGNVHGILGNDYQALDYYLQSYQYSKDAAGDSQIYALGNIGMIYGDLKEYDKALEYSKKAIAMSYEYSTPPNLYYTQAFDYPLAAYCFNKLGQLDSCKMYVDSTLVLIEKLSQEEHYHFREAVCEALYLLGQIAMDNGNLDDALTYFTNIKEDDLNYLDVPTNAFIAEIQMKKGNYSLAASILNKSEVDGEIKQESNKYNLLAECYAKMGKYDLAYKNVTTYNALESQYNEDEREKYLAYTDARLENQKKTDQINLLEANDRVTQLRLKNQRVQFFGIGILALFLSVLAYILYKRSEERKNRAEELQNIVNQRTKDLQVANNELKVFNYAASHDLKEPLNTVDAFVKLLKKDYQKRDDQSKDHYFEILDSSLSNTKGLVENLARFTNVSEQDNYDQSIVSLKRLSEDVVNSIHSLIEQKHVQVSINEPMPEVMSSSPVLYTVFKNIMENGIKFNDKQAPTISMSYTESDTYHIIYIKDNGIGMHKHQIDLIFDSFYRLNSKSVYPGSGLGLSISKLLIEKIGGKINVRSELGVGSTFEVYLPKS